jgi:hypothetical protein
MSLLETMKEQSAVATVPSATPAGSSNAVVQVEQQRAVAETQSKIFLAKQFPRNQVEALERIMQACARPSLAQGALYSYPKGGTNVSGPSIRLAEAIAQNWGNIEYGVRELEQRNGESIMESYAWDMETNVCQRKTFTVKHLRHTKKGAYTLEDPREVYEVSANYAARRLRACILGIIPGDIVEEAVKQCEQTLTTKFDITPENIKKMLDDFTAFKVTKEMIEKRVGRRVDTISPAQMMQLHNIYNSLSDGMSKPADYFEMEPVPDEGAKVSGNDAVKERMKKAAYTPPATDTPDAPSQQTLGVDPSAISRLDEEASQ